MTRYISLISLIAVLSISSVFAGNPDRAGVAGASELLINPWARSAGLMGVNTASIHGAEAMRFNVGGLAFTQGTEFLISHTRYLEGSDIKINSAAFAQKMGKGGVFGISVMAMDFGQIQITTAAFPAGGLGDYEPQFTNIGVSYAKSFSESIHGGLLIRLINESTPDVRANGIGLDAGIQYVTGATQNVKFGIALRNVGTELKFKGDGLANISTNQNGNEQTLNQRAEGFELPSLLTIGLTYDFNMEGDNRLSLSGNFTSNSFNNDQIGGGLEYAYKERAMLRVGYDYELRDEEETLVENEFDGLGAGVSFDIPFTRNQGTSLGLDYAYRSNRTFDGTHSFGLRLGLANKNIVKPVEVQAVKVVKEVDDEALKAAEAARLEAEARATEAEARAAELEAKLKAEEVAARAAADAAAKKAAEEKAKLEAMMAERAKIKAEATDIIQRAAKTIAFQTGSATLLSTSKPGLDELAGLLIKYPQAKLNISAHTDNVGADATNMALSQRRAESVRNYFISKGVDAANMTARWYGETQPAADNGTAEGRAMNRRVEMEVTF